MPQQQQSNIVKPQVIGAPKAPMSTRNAQYGRDMKSSYNAALKSGTMGLAGKALKNAMPKPMKAAKAPKKAAKKTPTFSQVEKSIARSKGY